MIVTIKELASSLKVAYPVASALVALMVQYGEAKKVGKRPAATASGKGKPSDVYEIPDSFTVQLSNGETALPAEVPAPAVVAAEAFADIAPPPLTTEQKEAILAAEVAEEQAESDTVVESPDVEPSGV